MTKVILFIVGIMFCSIGLGFTVLYLNLITIGYSFSEFVQYIFRRGECLIFFLGVVLILLSFERWIKNEFLLRYINKHERRKNLRIL